MENKKKIKDLHHGCYSSSDINGYGILKFKVPATCNLMDCHVQVGFLHSWNTALIGNTSCSLHKHLFNERTGTQISVIDIDGQDSCFGATIPVMSEFPINVAEGSYSVKCRNLIVNRMSCMLDLLVNAMVIV